MGDDKRDNWEMPKPVFRQTSGALPKGFAKKDDNWEITAAPDAKAPEPNSEILSALYSPPEGYEEKPPPAPAAKPAVEIEEQPSISEQFTVAETVGEPAAKIKPKGGFFGKLLIVLIVGVLLAIGFVAVIVYLFYSSTSQPSTF